MAADRSVFGYRARFLRHVPQYGRISVHRESDGAAIAVVHESQRLKHRFESVDAGESVYGRTGRRSKHVCDRSEFPDRIRAQLDIIRPTRSTVRIADDGDLFGYEGDKAAPGISAKHVPDGRDQPSGLRLSGIQRQLLSGGRTDPVAPAAPKRIYGDPAVHLCESH